MVDAGPCLGNDGWEGHLRGNRTGLGDRQPSSSLARRGSAAVGDTGAMGTSSTGPEAIRERPVLVYDGDCAFCTKAVGVVETLIKPDADMVAWQFADLGALGTTRERAEYELLWVHRDGGADGGAQAVASLLRHAGGIWAALGWIARIPPFRWLAHGAYRLVANNRGRLPGGTPACSLPADQRPGARRVA